MAKDREIHHPFCNYQTGDPNECKHCDPLYEKHPIDSDNFEDAMKECQKIIEEEYPDAQIVE